MVLVATGCEESGRGAAWALERAMRDSWPRENTTIIGLDMLSGGALRYHVEGEILPIWPSVPETARHIARFDLTR